jgi:hypothetical protein
LVGDHGADADKDADGDSNFKEFVADDLIEQPLEGILRFKVKLETGILLHNNFLQVLPVDLFIG